MPVMIHCPECHDRYEVSDAAAEKLVRCRRCQCPIHADAQEIPADAIQVDAAPAMPAKSRPIEVEDRSYDGPRHHRSPRAPFPWTAILLVVIGILFFLLAFSVAFNVWFITRAENNARFAEQKAQNQARNAEQMAAMAREQEKDAVKGWGVLKGRVRLQGDPPVKRDLKKEIARDKQGARFLNGPEEDLLDPVWTINPDNQGVANVVVTLRAADGKPLAIPAQERKPRPNVVLDIHGANFRPHIVVLTPKLGDFDTGQKLTVRNTSKVNNCLNIKTGPRNEPVNYLLEPDKQRDHQFVAEPQPLNVDCEHFEWKSARIWVFDHPYHAITDKNGVFEIPFAPRGVDLRLILWHEAHGFVDGKDGRAYRMNAEQDEQEMLIPAKK